MTEVALERNKNNSLRNENEELLNRLSNSLLKIHNLEKKLITNLLTENEIKGIIIMINDLINSRRTNACLSYLELLDLKNKLQRNKGT